MSVKSRKRYRRPHPAGTIVVINKGNRIEDPPKMWCHFGRPLAFLIVNLDTVAHAVWIDPDRVVLKRRSKVRANPFALGSKKVKVGAGRFAMLRQRIKHVSHYER